MPGTYARDALAPNLFTGATLNAAGTTAGTIVDLSAEGTDVMFEIVTGTVTGTTPTLNVEIEASPSPTFASGVVSLGKFDQIGDEDAVTRRFTTFVPLRYVRAQVVIAGTTPVYTGSTLTPRTKHDRRTASQTA